MRRGQQAASSRNGEAAATPIRDIRLFQFRRRRPDIRVRMGIFVNQLQSLPHLRTHGEPYRASFVHVQASSVI